MVIIHKIGTIRSRVGYLSTGSTGSTLGKVWALLESLRYGLLPLETVKLSIGLYITATQLNNREKLCSVGSKELACGSQAFIATLLFDPSMSALPIIPKQNSVSVGLFTH